MLPLHRLAFILCFATTSFAVQLRSKTSQDERPNILWILADDLHYESGVWDGPNLRKMKDESIEFRNHMTQSPLCGPSRASLLVGRYPHNAGYMYNAQQESIDAFKKIQDASVGKWLNDVGYHTAYLGKYVNGIVDHVDHLPKGWRYFGGFTEQFERLTQKFYGGAYAYYNTSQWDVEFDEHGEKLKEVHYFMTGKYPIKIWDGVHQADFLAMQTLEQAKVAINHSMPFFIFTNPVMVHHGSCQSFNDTSLYAHDDPWHEEHDLDILAPISPCVKKEHNEKFMRENFGNWTLHNRPKSFGVTAVGQRPGGQNCCDAPGQLERIEIGARNRTASLVDLDEMVGIILDGLREMNVLDNTYVFFTSDNGYHLGEHKFYFGKELPYEHDLRVPMAVRTPAGIRGLSKLPTTHIDITRTIVALTGAKDAVKPSLDELDGKSFIGALNRQVPVTEWRTWSYAEMFSENGRTWRSIRHLNDDGDPWWSMSLWCGGEVEVFDLQQDELQLMNGVNKQFPLLTLSGDTTLDPRVMLGKKVLQGRDLVQDWIPILSGMGSCKGERCSDSQLVYDGNRSDKISNIEDCMFKTQPVSDLVARMPARKLDSHWAYD